MRDLCSGRTVQHVQWVTGAVGGVQAVRAASDAAAAKAALAEGFGMTEAQAEGVLSLTLRRLTGLEAQKLGEERGSLVAG